MKYAIMVSYYMWNEKENKEYEEWLYLALEGERKLFVFEENVTDRTKLFGTAKEAGEYLDKHFGPDKQRCSYSAVKIVEV